MTIDKVIRFPGHYWVRLFAKWGADHFEPGHRWLYRGIIRRDAWRVGPLCFGVMRMPRTSASAEFLDIWEPR